MTDIPLQHADRHETRVLTADIDKLAAMRHFAVRFFRLAGLTIFAALFRAVHRKASSIVRDEIRQGHKSRQRMTGSRPGRNNGSVFQWIEFQIPILKMQVRFLPGLLYRIAFLCSPFFMRFCYS